MQDPFNASVIGTANLLYTENKSQITDHRILHHNIVYADDKDGHMISDISIHKGMEGAEEVLQLQLST